MADRITLLGQQSGRAHFDCGNHALNDFLQRHAGQQQRRGLGKTYVAQRDDLPDILGFVTVSVGQVATEALPSPPRLPQYPVPILRIGRLAVDRRYQGHGIGQNLLAFALHLAVEFSERVGLYAVVVDAKHDSAARFYQRLGFTATLDDPLCLYVPVSQLIVASKP
ncbi:GNAT family N-acetyltransferase [Acidithiobacillus sp. MC6.1]|nr:GNAT family N-acetyltransferase [Acidithiobacillus sp. MC6.1]